MKNTDKTPNYYKGKVYGYKAFDIIEDFELNYNFALDQNYNDLNYGIF